MSSDPPKTVHPLLQDLARLLAEQGLTRVVFAQKCGMTPAALSKIMRGHHSPTLVTMDRMCTELGMQMLLVPGTPGEGVYPETNYDLFEM